MMENTIGLSRDLIIHPGETLQEVLEGRGMSQKELSARISMSESFVSKVIKGEKPISNNMAKKLEYALSIDARFWANLQSNYNQELEEYKERENITEEELSIVKIIKEIVNFAQTIGLIPQNGDDVSRVVEMRKMLNVSCLTNIPKVALSGCYRKAKDIDCNIYILFAWQKVCELLGESIKVKSKLDTNKLKEKIPEIKSVMFQPAEKMQGMLQEIFSECGVAFCLTQNFRGAPVQGFINNRQDGTLMLCMTIRGKYADRFWFTLFHEIAHILNGDVKKSMIDFEFSRDEMEDRADADAANMLIPIEDYNTFVAAGDFSLLAIKKMAARHNVKPYIVIGRLQNQKLIPYTYLAQEKVKYVWANE